MEKHTADWSGRTTAGHSDQRSLDTGESLFRQGDPATALYRVVTGRIRLVRHLEDGASLVVWVARAGDTFAEAALFAEQYHCDAVAEAPSVVAPVPKARLRARLEADPVQCLDFARDLAAQVRDLRARLEIRNIRSAGERVLAWLRLQAKGDPPRVTLDRPWTHIASEIGLTSEATYRALGALERSGRIVRRPGTVELS